jgi:ectoine hydroxylase-related dioxygenase (phytanoyl-CoA dioxygenase family)
VLTNRRDTRAPLPRVFGDRGIPSGAGDCVVPKLLAAANVAGARVVGVAEAWWGPPHGARRHGALEPPCAARCQPLLGFLLCSCDTLPAVDDADAAFATALRDDGYAVVRGLLDAKTIDALQRATDTLQTTARDFVVDTAVGKVFFEVQSQSGRKRETAVAPGALRKITGPSKAQPAFASLRRDRRVLRLLQVAGLRTPRCVVDQVNFKEPGAGTGFPFHQDASFLHGDARRDLHACGGMNLVIALDAADEENGGFTVLGGTHKQGLLRDQHGYDTSTLNDGVFDESRRSVPALAPGDAVFFDPLLAHGSGLNRSSRRRRLVTLWFVGSEPRAIT